MRIRTASIASAAALAAFLAAPGCERARYVETGSPEGIISVNDVDFQDILKASSGMLESLGQTGVLKTAKNKPAQLIIGDVVNDTSSRFDVGEVTYRMREQLVNSGQATVVTYTFRLTLTNLRTGLEAWTKTVDMTKLGNKNAVGF